MSTHPTNDQLQAEHIQSLHQQLLADIETLHAKETSLKDYETRLRSLLERSAGSTTPFQAGKLDGTTVDLDAAWEKFHRSQALFEAERRAFKDERLLLREQLAAVKKREEDVARRESWIERREKEFATTAAAAVVVPTTPPGKRSLTTAPFLAVKSMFTRGS
ncbi:MAG: hypothetical protein HY302_12085 [Opitutae bacterium]|nr:hypothetical protein [Opitutae bacterium]